MKTDDAKKKLCPLLSNPPAREHCGGAACALWRGDEKEGGCGLVIPDPSESLKKIDFAELALKVRAAFEAAMTPPPMPYRRRGTTKHDA